MDLNVEPHKSLELLWETIYDEYLMEFGLSKDYKQVMKLKKSIALQKADYIEKEDRILLNFIAADEIALKDLYERTKNSVTFRKSLEFIEKKQGVKQNLRKITVGEYFSYLKQD